MRDKVGISELDPERSIERADLVIEVSLVDALQVDCIGKSRRGLVCLHQPIRRRDLFCGTPR